MVASRHLPRTLALLAATACGGGPALAAGDRELGRYLAAECAACHRPSGASAGIPAIVGLPEDAFIAMLKEYRDKKRSNTVMQTIAGKFGDAEVEALAAYFGALKP